MAGAKPEAKRCVMQELAKEKYLSVAGRVRRKSEVCTFSLTLSVSYSVIRE